MLTLNTLKRLRAWWAQPLLPTTERQRADDPIRGVDVGGIPLHSARVNAIARSLGLELSIKAPVEHTIARIRKALAR